MKTTLLIMTLNEINGMKAIMPQIDPDWLDQILVCDGNSTDGTIEWAREQGYQVYVQKEKGIRQAYYEVWPLVEGDVVLTFSPDGNSIPEAIPELLEKMREGYDMVIASRYKGDAKSDDDDVITGFGNWLFTKTANVLFGGSYTDVMVILRAYKKDLPFRLGLDQDAPFDFFEKIFFCFHRETSWEPLLSARAVKYGYKVGETSASEPPRIGGERKLRVMNWGSVYYAQFWTELFRSKKPSMKRPPDY
jgi:glycosyltransferase involved in cell wall biosynthesis